MGVGPPLCLCVCDGQEEEEEEEEDGYMAVCGTSQMLIRVVYMERRSAGRCPQISKNVGAAAAHQSGGNPHGPGPSRQNAVQRRVNIETRNIRYRSPDTPRVKRKNKKRKFTPDRHRIKGMRKISQPRSH